MKEKKVLVVDDDKDFLFLMARKISEDGYQVFTALDGIQALKLAYNEIPDVIILDIMLPAGGGISILKKLKGSTKTHVIPVIAITASDDPGIKEEALENNAAEFMIKPFSPEELIEKIWKYT